MCKSNNKRFTFKWLGLIMETENFNPAEARKTIRFATVCIAILILAVKFSFAEFYRFVLMLLG